MDIRNNHFLYFNQLNPYPSELLFFTEHLCDVGLEFCETYDMDVEKLTELWLTFCVNNDTDIDPAVDTLIKMERAILKEYKLHNSTPESHKKEEQSTMEKHYIANEAMYPLTLKLIITLSCLVDKKYDWKLFYIHISPYMYKHYSENDDVLSMYGYVEGGPSKVSL